MRQTALIAIPALCAGLLAAGCDRLPRDAAGTSERIEQTGMVRVAVLPATPDAAPALALLRRYAARHGASLSPVSLHGEHALHALEEGRVDVVVGHLAKDSPWKTDVALSRAIAGDEPPDGRRPVLRLARRNGENALILATDRAIAAVRK